MIMAIGNSPVSIGNALRETLAGLKLGFLLHEAKLRRRWSEVVGERAAEMAEMESLKDFVLNVRVSQATWRQELPHLPSLSCSTLAFLNIGICTPPPLFMVWAWHFNGLRIPPPSAQWFPRNNMAAPMA